MRLLGELGTQQHAYTRDRREKEVGSPILTRLLALLDTFAIIRSRKIIATDGLGRRFLLWTAYSDRWRRRTRTQSLILRRCRLRSPKILKVILTSPPHLALCFPTAEIQRRHGERQPNHPGCCTLLPSHSSNFGSIFTNYRRPQNRSNTKTGFQQKSCSEFSYLKSILFLFFPLRT